MASYENMDHHTNLSAFDLTNRWNNTPAGKAEDRWRNSPSSRLHQEWLNSPAGKIHQKLANDPFYRIPKSISNIPESMANIKLLAAGQKSLIVVGDLKRRSAYSNMTNSGNYSSGMTFSNGLTVGTETEKLMRLFPRSNFSSYLSLSKGNLSASEDFRIQIQMQKLDRLLGTDIGPRSIQQIKSLRLVTKQKFTKELLSSIDKVSPDTRIEENIDIQHQSSDLSEAANLVDWEDIIEEAKAYAEESGSQNQEDITERDNIVVPSLDLLAPRIFDYLAFIFNTFKYIYTQTKGPAEYFANIATILTALGLLIKYLNE